ncbi:PD-(D/E)XK nuclease family protein [Clostridioides mangenotii]|uniref:PD-(D/E)XK nuclease family protein n=1 Tax=Metaclostridioides mangenotii TaxID=1540 RepID=UPI001C1037C6|nr:PD-(D/E)XK nuclease family protein [Clostridioides mangenotii]MBU5307569.1 PD-(D/E)XK nuclease family protein [Clostridioides mangenotii]
MNKRLENFNYSQNSINTYKSCPVKFKYKYIDKINWMKDDIESRGYYDSLKKGLDFHLLCERYFNSIPVGIDQINNDDKNKFTKWLDKIKHDIPIVENKKYLTEYEISLNLNGNHIKAKYDLIVLGNNSIEIWDWKTEARKINFKNVESRVQTIVYLFLAKEVIPRLFNIEVDYENIKMIYYQPEFENTKISISYSEEKHKLFRTFIEHYVDIIKRTDFDDGKFIESEVYKNNSIDQSLKINAEVVEDDNIQKTEEIVYNNIEHMCCNDLSINNEEMLDNIKLTKNKKHCNYCEFNKLCNNLDVDFDILESEVYGT